MCGIVGLWSDEQRDRARAITVAMRDSLAHRGPDDAGLWSEDGIHLGQRRLAIVDLSKEGHQPMASVSGRYVITFNGEVYNHRAIRAELGRGQRYRGTSDTETMLAAIERWGLDGALERFVGMFAFALWDRRERTLALVRDRVGIKPLYWGRTSGGAVLFGSELRALARHPEFDRAVDREALAEFFAASCVPAPRTIYRAARKLRPGAILTFRGQREEPDERIYWSPRRILAAGLQDPLAVGDREGTDLVENALRESIALRLLADVPVGAFLSGGVDSSLVVAVAQQLRDRPLRTYSIGSADKAYDESTIAADVARHLGTEHTSLVIGDTDVREVVPVLGSMYDEPFADSSQIPTFLVSRLARRDVTVALSGDGGDELFGGYNRYLWAPRVLSIVGRVPSRARRGVSKAIRAISRERWDAVHRVASPPLPSVRLPGEKAHKLARALEADDVATMYRALRSQWSSSPVRDVSATADRARSAGSIARTLMVLDLERYLPDDILTKVDRASMAVALEVRVPILDHRVLALAARLPERFGIRNGVGKWVLREILARHVPRTMFERPKTGFAVPVGAWLRGPLRGWCDDLLSRTALRDAGLDADLVLERWREHGAGLGDWGGALWDVLMFRSWQMATSAPTPHMLEAAS